MEILKMKNVGLELGWYLVNEYRFYEIGEDEVVFDRLW